ncbi:SDR family NAD(P)-dependent oxidoreductase [Acidithiobacillus ferriphilus]|uniref:SDR family NAD(P)-dependent oxidoreductase n=1 Tax=Acidithiobacillus ferriphilus TaxID=1689834 RepID=UPI0023313AE5|nr:SDR family NAD(P)-dependent oxidoreductase [Acidithiobacillus ferriphilus]WCE93255.1 SDR family oxidoreductase [Acidithiobacillus ferriphilus]
MPARNALITGASRGIGKAIARQLIDDDFICILVSRSIEALAETVADLSADGGTVVGKNCDVTDPVQVERLFSDVIKTLGGIDVLVNCAGRAGGGSTKDLTNELWLDVINTNLNSVFFVTRTALKSGAVRNGGSIINIASTGGKQGVVHGAPYSASKHGVVGFTKALGLELATNRTDITVNAVCPGFVETEMADQVRANYGKLWGVSPEEVKKRIEARIPIGRYIEPEEVAAMVSFLASDRARGITAQAMNVCGGLGNY